MITDALTQFCTAQAVTTTAFSNFSVDLSVARDVAVGNDLYVCFTVDQTVTAAGAATVTFQIVTADSTDLATNTTIIGEIESFPISELVAGRRPMYLPINPNPYLAQAIGKRYLGVNFVIGTGPLTAGKFSAALTTNESNSSSHYPSGCTVA